MHTPDTSMLNEIFEGEFEWNWEATIRALIRTGKAEILSRPSVLTLDNRQSTIRVGQDIPIASSLEGLGSDSTKVSFQFDYLPTGILLNIRPRINESGAEVSMLIDTIVSAKVPGEDLEMKSAERHDSGVGPDRVHASGADLRPHSQQHAADHRRPGRPRGHADAGQGPDPGGPAGDRLRRSDRRRTSASNARSSSS